MGSFRFEYEEGGEVQTFSFEGDRISIGRGQSSDFLLDHPTVSRRHAEVVAEPDGRFRLVALSDRGLTAVDGSEVDQEAELRDGSRVYFGQLQFRFRSDRARAGASDSGASAAPSRSERRSPAPAQSGGGAFADEQAGASVVSGSSREPESNDEGDGVSGVGGPPDIETWDEVAESGMDEESTGASGDTPSAGGGSAAPDGRAGGASEQEEETDPLIVGVGLVLSAAMLAYTFWPSGGGPSGTGTTNSTSVDTPVEVQVECLSEQECRRAALKAYRVGSEYLKKKEAESSNLFLAYKRFLETRKYLKKAELSQKPEEISELDAKIEKLRGELDSIFRNYRVKYRSATKNGRHRAMARALQTVQTYFPDKSSREYRWARERILRMKEKGTYPAGMGAEF